VLQQQAEDGRPYTLKDAAKLAAGATGVAGPVPEAASGVGGLIAAQRDGRRMENARGRMELALMADAGYDPHQAPEAWRRLSPGSLPKDLTKLKNPSGAYIS
jgi:hypothetical protein